MDQRHRARAVRAGVQDRFGRNALTVLGQWLIRSSHSPAVNRFTNNSAAASTCYGCKIIYSPPTAHNTLFLFRAACCCGRALRCALDRARSELLFAAAKRLSFASGLEPRFPCGKILEYETALLTLKRPTATAAGDLAIHRPCGFDPD